MTPPPPRESRLELTGLLLVTGGWLLLTRWLLHAGWGFIPDEEGGAILPGIVCNPGDTWSYLSWAQQYAHGSALARMLYTTETHSAQLWLFPLWLIGRTASLTHLPLLGVYNAAGFIGALVSVGFFHQTAITLGLPRTARRWACVALVFGTGSSWCWHALAKIGLCPPALIPEFFYLDLFPATTFIAYAYHSVSWVLLTALWWQTAEYENRRLAGLPTCGTTILLITAAALLSVSRPYEPAVFLAAWWLKTVWLGWRRQAIPAAWTASRDLALILTACLGPGLVWNLWVATRPVWTNFATASLTLGSFGRGTWLITIGGWLLLAALGALPAWQATRHRTLLPLCATLIFAFVLLVLGSGRVKLASGLMLGPALLAGWGLHWLGVRARKRVGGFRHVVMVSAAIALLGLPSLYLCLHGLQLQPPARIPVGLWQLAPDLHRKTDAAPRVLTVLTAGAVLPGLTGSQVWAGHFSLTCRYEEKQARLRQAGLDPDVSVPPPGQADNVLDGILHEAAFDYALLPDRCHEPLVHLRTIGWTQVAAASGWTLLAAPKFSDSSPSRVGLHL